MSTATDSAAAEGTAADGAGPAGVAAVRRFLGGRRRRNWTDWYTAGFAAVLAGIYGSDFLAGPLSRLNAQASHAAATQAAALQATAGAGLVIAVGMGLLLLAQALGPLALSPADASWLLLTPLSRRAVLRRSATLLALLGAAAGALLGVLGLAMAGPYLRLTGSGFPGSWLFLSAAAGAGCALAAVAAAALAQPAALPRAVIRAACVTVAALAAAGALAGKRWASVTHAVTSVFGGLSTPVFDTAAVAGLALAAIAWLLLWRRLRSFPVGVLRDDSARSGRALLAAQFFNFSLLFWIAEDNHWRGRIFRSRPWPRLPPALVLAWADWRRLRRRPGPLLVLAAGSVVPTLLGIALTKDRNVAAAVVLLAGAFAVCAQGTVAAKRDMDDAALRRLLGVGAGRALLARTVLPALLASWWLALALTLALASGALHGSWHWPLLGLAAGPGVTAGALRLARTARIDPADRGPDTPMGNTPPWLFSRMISVIVSVIGTAPLIGAMISGKAPWAVVADQCVLSVIVLSIYLAIARAVSL